MLKIWSTAHVYDNHLAIYMRQKVHEKNYIKLITKKKAWVSLRQTFCSKFNVAIRAKCKFPSISKKLVL